MYVELEQIIAQLALLQVKLTLHNYQKQFAKLSIAKELSNNIDFFTLLFETLFVVIERFEKSIKYTKYKEKINIEFK